MSFLLRKAQNWAQDSKCNFITAKVRGMVIALVLLSTIVNPHQDDTDILAHIATCWLSKPRSFSTRHLSRQSSQPVVLCGVVMTQRQDLALALIESHILGLSLQIHCSNPTAGSSYPQKDQYSCPSWCCQWVIWLRGHLIPLSRWLIKTFNRTRVSTEPEGHQCPATFLARPSSQFFTQGTNLSCKQPVSPGDYCWKSCERLC